MSRAMFTAADLLAAGIAILFVFIGGVASSVRRSRTSVRRSPTSTRPTRRLRWPRGATTTMNEIHPSVVIAGDVRFGTGNVIGPNVVVYGPVTIGDDNWIGAGVVIGAPPEVRSFAHPRGGKRTAGAGARIGDGNVIREYAQIHQGWKQPTVIGDDAFIMNQVYVAHDCVLADGVTLASSVLLAGHVHVGDRANLGLGTAVHQGRHVGQGCDGRHELGRDAGHPSVRQGVREPWRTRRVRERRRNAAARRARGGHRRTRGGLRVRPRA